MARPGRYTSGLIKKLHLIQRGNNCDAIVFVAEDEARDSDWLIEEASDDGGGALGDARLMQQIAKALGRRFAPLPKGRPKTAKAERRRE